MPKVSVIIAVYNVEQYIERCARSLFGQTLDDIEYLFIDDCTPDRSIDILKNVLEEYPSRAQQVIIHRMDKNSGQAKVREWGLKNATGDYVIHCDSDDWIECNMYESMYSNAILNKSDIVICDYKVVSERGQVVIECTSHTDKGEYLSELLRLKTPWSLCNKLVRRGLIEARDFQYPTNNMGEDMLLTTQIILNSTTPITFINKPYYNYFFNDTSITQVQSEDALYKHWIQSCNNAMCVCEILRKKELHNIYATELVKLKYLQKKLAGALSRKGRYSKEWLELFPEIHSKLIFCKDLSNLEKVKFYITLFLAKINTYKKWLL